MFADVREHPRCSALSEGGREGSFANVREHFGVQRGRWEVFLNVRLHPFGAHPSVCLPLETLKQTPYFSGSATQRTRGAFFVVRSWTIEFKSSTCDNG